MNLMRRTFILSASTLPLLAALPASADAVVTVTLWDKPGMDMATGMGHGMGGAMSGANMGIDVSATAVPAGPVTFNATNASHDIMHEMVVARLAAADAVLPYDDSTGRVDEEAAGDFGEIADLDPGDSGSLTLTLQPGTYILYCNLPGHYMAGMWATITVE